MTAGDDGAAARSSLVVSCDPAAVAATELASISSNMPRGCLPSMTHHAGSASAAPSKAPRPMPLDRLPIAPQERPVTDPRIAPVNAPTPRCTAARCSFQAGGVCLVQLLTAPRYNREQNPNFDATVKEVANIGRRGCNTAARVAPTTPPASPLTAAPGSTHCVT